jgi:hypothetical protein
VSSAEDWGGDGPELAYAAGDIIGHREWEIRFEPRSWLVDSLGLTSPRRGPQVALQSVYRPYLWRPGENVASCLPTAPSTPVARPLARIPTDRCARSHEHTSAWPRENDCLRDHLPGVDPGHTCGFYAYTLPEVNNTFAPVNKPHIEGLLQGYGVTTIGEKGFRCSKARILALIRPRPVRRKPGMTMAMSMPRLIMEQISYERLAAHFGVPLFDTRAEALEEFPLGMREGRFVMQDS